MAVKLLEKLIYGGGKCMKSTHTEALRLNSNVMLYHCSKDLPDEELLASPEWRDKAFLKVTKLARLLKNVDSVDGRLVDIRDGSVVISDQAEQKMRSFKSLSRVLIGCSSVQLEMKANVSRSMACFSEPSERESMTVTSLTSVANFLNISAQQRKVIRATICPQVTQQRILTGALKEILNGLKPELESVNYRFPSKRTHMGQQIVDTCLNLLQETVISSNVDSISWMRLAPVKGARSSASPKWEDVLEMFNDLIECLKTEDVLVDHVVKLETMKDGLSQIKDVLMDKSIGYKEVQHQASLVQKKLSKFLGFSSQCLFTLLLYYLFGSVRDVEVDLCGGIYRNEDEKSFCLCMGRILSSDDETMVSRGVKQLYRALALHGFMWETAGMKEVLDLQGHLWCVGAEFKVITYKGKQFYLHGISI